MSTKKDVKKKEFTSPVSSKTLIANGIAAVALLIQNKYGFVISPEDQAAIIVAGNVLLRFITKHPIKWKS
jgi:hypothetical protein